MSFVTEEILEHSISTWAYFSSFLGPAPSFFLTSLRPPPTSSHLSSHVQSPLSRFSFCHVCQSPWDPRAKPAAFKMTFGTTTEQWGPDRDCFSLTFMCFMSSLISFHDQGWGKLQRRLLVSQQDTMTTASFVCLCTLWSPASLSATASCREACMIHAGIQMEVRYVTIADWPSHLCLKSLTQCFCASVIKTNQAREKMGSVVLLGKVKGMMMVLMIECRTVSQLPLLKAALIHHWQHILQS